MPMHRRWPLAIILIVAGFLAFSAWSFRRAADEASAVTDRDYYSHGLRYNQTLLERQAAASLGWTSRATLEGRLLRVELRDRAARPVTAARASVTVHDGAGGTPLHLPLAETAVGFYAARLPDNLRGELPALLDFDQNGARLSQRLLLALP